MRKLINFSIMFLLMFSLPIVISGCTMPLSLAKAAMDIHDATASTKINFVDEEKTGVTRFQKLAIWPGDQSEVLTAENLQSKGISIVTPSAVGKVIQEQNLEKVLNNLTHSEVLKTLRTVCEKTGADSVIGSKNKKIILFSLAENKIVWSAKIQAAHKKNSSEEKFLEMIVDLVSDKIILLSEDGFIS